MPSADRALQAVLHRSWRYEGTVRLEFIRRGIGSGRHPLSRSGRGHICGLCPVIQRELKACLISYIAYGWTGLIPETCRKMVVLVPVNIAPWLWGWPDRFLGRMGSVGSEVFTVGPYHGGEFSTGIDTREDLARLPPHYSGGVSTNEIETIARALKTEKQ